MTVSTSVDRRCRVCDNLYDGAQHCGVEICRACAAFFKRSIQSKRVYKCKSGRNNCANTDRYKHWCQSCRLLKCRNVGLKANLMSINDPCCSKDQHTTSTEQSQFKLNENSSYLTDNITMPILTRFCYFYKKVLGARIKFETGLKMERNEPEAIAGSKSLAVLPSTDLPKIFRFNQKTLMQIINGVFPKINDFPPQSKEYILPQLMFVPLDLETAYRTYRIFMDPNCTKVINTQTMYLDTNNMMSHLKCDKTRTPIENKHLCECLRIMFSDYLQTTHSYLHRIKITDFEFMAALALIFWSDDIYKDDENCTEIAEKERSLIYKELDYYYRIVMKVENHVERVLNLQGLKIYLKTNAFRMRDNVQYLRVFNYFTGDPVFVEDASKLPCQN